MQQPLVVEMAGAVVLCVGGGAVATAKVRPLVEAGAQVAVISPRCTDELRGMSAWECRTWTAGDLQRDPPVHLAVAATGVPAVDDAVAEEAAASGTWCLRVDGRGTVAMPAVVRRGGLVVSVSTGVPALTARIRREVDELIPDAWGDGATVLARLRADRGVRAALSALEPRERRRRWLAAVEVVLDADRTATADVLARRLLVAPDREDGA